MDVDQVHGQPWKVLPLRMFVVIVLLVHILASLELPRVYLALLVRGRSLKGHLAAMHARLVRGQMRLGLPVETSAPIALLVRGQHPPLRHRFPFALDVIPERGPLFQVLSAVMFATAAHQGHFHQLLLHHRFQIVSIALSALGHPLLVRRFVFSA